MKNFNTCSIATTSTTNTNNSLFPFFKIGTNKISYNSTLILDGDIYIKNLTLDGSLILSSQEKKEFNDLTFTEKNYVDFVAIGEDEQRIEHKMRGFKSSGNENIKKL